MDEAEQRREAAALAADRGRLREIQALRAEAIAESEHGWRSFLFTIVDSLAAGVALGLGAMMWFVGVAAALLSPELGTAGLLVLGGFPLLALTIVLAAIFGPLHGGNTPRHQLFARVLLLMWLIAVVAFFVAVLYLLAA